MTVNLMEQPSVVSSVSPTKKKVGGSLLRRLRNPKPTFRRASGGVKATTTSTVRRSCLKKPIDSSEAQQQDENVSNNSAALFSSRMRKRRCRKVHWDKANLVIPPPPCDYRDPSLWWSADDVKMRRIDDYRSTLHCEEAESYALQCRTARTTTCANPATAQAVLESSASNKRAENRLKRVFFRTLLPGYLEGFRGMESPGGALGGGPGRMDFVRAHTRRVVVAQRSCSSQQDLAEIAVTNTRTSRCWARLLALGDELIVKAIIKAGDL